MLIIAVFILINVHKQYSMFVFDYRIKKITGSTYTCYDYSIHCNYCTLTIP